MKKKDKEVIESFALTYVTGLLPCFCATTGDKYPLTFTKNHYQRFCDYLEERFNIEIKSTDLEEYKLYEGIMLTEINKYIDECKTKKAQEEKENKKKTKKK